MVLVRLLLGIAQMVGAVLSAILIIQTGLTWVSLAATLIISLLTLLSLLLFDQRYVHR